MEYGSEKVLPENVWGVVVDALLVGDRSFRIRLPQIQAAIKAKGQKWIAGETSISILPDNEKRMRLELIKHGPTGKEKSYAVSNQQEFSVCGRFRNRYSDGACRLYMDTSEQRAMADHSKHECGFIHL